MPRASTKKTVVAKPAPPKVEDRDSLYNDDDDIPGSQQSNDSNGRGFSPSLSVSPGPFDIGIVAISGLDTFVGCR